jgi:hypothetical protein
MAEANAGPLQRPGPCRSADLLQRLRGARDDDRLVMPAAQGVQIVACFDPPFVLCGQALASTNDRIVGLGKCFAQFSQMKILSKRVAPGRLKETSSTLSNGSSPLGRARLMEAVASPWL